MLSTVSLVEEAVKRRKLASAGITTQHGFAVTGARNFFCKVRCGRVAAADRDCVVQACSCNGGIAKCAPYRQPPAAVTLNDTSRSEPVPKQTGIDWVYSR